MDYFKKVNKIFLLKNIFIKGFMLALSLIIFDKYDLFCLLINKIGVFAFFIVLLILFIELVSSVGIKHIFDKNINLFDRLSLICLISSASYMIYFCNFTFKYYKLIVILLFMLLSIILILIKMFINKKEEEERKSNVLKLGDIIKSKNKIKISSKKKYYIEDSDVNYDLINRTDTINHLYTSIINCHPLNSFTIGLEGKWGLGKTTLINNVLKLMEENNKKSDYLIIQFDPWKYDNEKAILEGFAKETLNSVGYDLDAKETIELIENILCAVFENKDYNLISSLFKKSNEIPGDIRLDEIVNNYLVANQKELLLIIDNLDRIDSKKAIFLIKCIASITKFKRTINILLYDEKIINRILSQVFNSENNYMSKIVQLRITVPETNYVSLNMLKNKIFDNMILGNADLSSVIKDIDMKFDDVRQLKTFINSVITYPYEYFNMNLKDDLCLKYIKVRSPKLYYEIWHNKIFFISYDRVCDEDFLYYFELEKNNSECKSYFEKLSGEFSDFNNLLRSMFVTYDNYLEERNPMSMGDGEKDYKTSRKEKRISNARYFDLYFTRDKNEFTKIDSCVSKFIKMINANNHEGASIYLHKLFETYDPDSILVFLDTLQLNESEIKENIVYNIVIILLNELDKYSDRPVVMDSIRKVASLIADVIIRCNKRDMKKITSYYNKKYNTLYVFECIQYWIDRNKKEGSKYSDDFDDFVNNMCSNIINKKIDIFNDSNYYKNNVWVLYRFCEKDFSKLEKYLKRVVNSNNIYKFLSSLISVSMNDSNSYGYTISKENLERLNYVNIDKLIKDHGEPRDEKERLILKIYNHSIQTKDPYDYYRLDKYILF